MSYPDGEVGRKAGKGRRAGGAGGQEGQDGWEEQQVHLRIVAASKAARASTHGVGPSSKAVMSHLLFDLRDVVRGFRRDRLYVGAVIGTLALTLGASTAVFS